MGIHFGETLSRSKLWKRNVEEVKWTNEFIRFEIKYNAMQIEWQESELNIK